VEGGSGWLGSSQCCQAAEILAKKLKRGRRKKVGRKNLWLKIGRIISRIGRTFFMYWPENNFGTWQNWQQHTHDNN
jgi:hypothetical protein